MTVSTTMISDYFTGRARERDEGAIQRWVQHTWPRLKKKPKT